MVIYWAKEVQRYYKKSEYANKNLVNFAKKLLYICICAIFVVYLQPKYATKPKIPQNKTMKRIIMMALLAVVWLGGSAAEKIQERVILYPSTDQNGDTLTLSGKLSVPTKKNPKGIILLTHYTICTNDEAPSNKLTADAKYFMEDYVLVIPDYIGYGVTVERIHPYLHGELAARNCVDMMLYTQPILDSMALGIPTDSIYIIGFSQGGATAMWTLRLLEEEYADRIHVKKCFAGSGPHDVASTYDEAMLKDYASVPAIIPMLIVGTIEAYGLNLNLEYFANPALCNVYHKYMEKKDRDMMPIYTAMPSHKVSYWLTPQGMDRSQLETQVLYGGLLRSSLIHYNICKQDIDSICPEWKPKAPLYVFHSTNDDLVPFVNSAHLQRCYADVKTIQWDFGKYGKHVPSMLKFLSKVQKMLEKE